MMFNKFKWQGRDGLRTAFEDCGVMRARLYNEETVRMQREIEALKRATDELCRKKSFMMKTGQRASFEMYKIREDRSREKQMQLEKSLKQRAKI